MRPSALALLWLGLLAARAGARPAETPELDAERDVLIDKIARGQDEQASLRRFMALLEQRDRVVPTSVRAQAEARARADLADAYRKTNDHEVSHRCTLSVDPAHPEPSRESRHVGDWGKLVRKEKIRLPPRNQLDPGEEQLLYAVAGQGGTYVFDAARFGPRNEPVEAKLGDLLMVCAGREDASKLPAGWSGRRLRSGFAFRLAEPPRIVKKASWRPIHISQTTLYWAIRDVAWKLPPDRYILTNLTVEADAGQGRYSVQPESGQDYHYLIEVPDKLARREALRPGEPVWVILGQPRFDKALGRLVLVVEDVERRYFAD